MCPPPHPFFALSKKGLPLPFSLVIKRIYMGTQLKEELNDFFWSLPGYFLFPRVRMAWLTLLLSPHVRDSLEDKSVLFHSKRPSFSVSLTKNRIYLGTHLKEELTILLWKLLGYSLLRHRQSRQEYEHFANG